MLWPASPSPVSPASSSSAPPSPSKQTASASTVWLVRVVDSVGHSFEQRLPLSNRACSVSLSPHFAPGAALTVSVAMDGTLCPEPPASPDPSSPDADGEQVQPQSHPSLSSRHSLQENSPNHSPKASRKVSVAAVLAKLGIVRTKPVTRGTSDPALVGSDSAVRVLGTAASAHVVLPTPSLAAVEPRVHVVSNVGVVVSFTSASRSALCRCHPPCQRCPALVLMNPTLQVCLSHELCADIADPAAGPEVALALHVRPSGTSPVVVSLQRHATANVAYMTDDTPTDPSLVLQLTSETRSSAPINMAPLLRCTLTLLAPAVGPTTCTLGWSLLAPSGVLPPALPASLKYFLAYCPAQQQRQAATGPSGPGNAALATCQILSDYDIDSCVRHFLRAALGLTSVDAMTVKPISGSQGFLEGLTTGCEYVATLAALSDTAMNM